MKPTPLTPKLLPSVSGCLPALQLAELTSEEAALRHRERASGGKGTGSRRSRFAGSS